MMPLAMLGQGQSGRIVQVAGGHGMRQHLSAMGFVPGERVTVVGGAHGGPLLLTVKGTRVAIGRGMAHKILVD